MLGFIPQVLKIRRIKSVRDVSLITLTQFSLGVFLWMLYSFHLKDVIIIIANAITFFSLMVALFYYFKLRKRKNE